MSLWDPLAEHWIRTGVLAAVGLGVLGIVVMIALDGGGGTDRSAPKPNGSSRPLPSASESSASPQSPTSPPPETSSTTPSPSASPTSPTADPHIRHHGALPLFSGNSATETDLDAPQSDPQWGRRANTGDASGDAPYISGSEITTGRAGVPMRLMDGEADYATCAGLGDPSGNTIPIGSLKLGSNICLKTTAARWARLVVTADPSGDKVGLDITVWEPH